MIDELRAQALLGPIRGEPAVDRERLADVLLGLSRVAVDDPDGGVDRPQPADRRRRGADRRRRARRGGSCELRLSTRRTSARSSTRAASSSRARARTRASSASSHSTTSFAVATRARSSPRTSKAARCSASTRCGRSRRSRAAWPISCSCARLPPRTSRCCKACAARGVRAAFVTSAGYGEAGAGRRGGAAPSSSAVANELGILLAGPNGQGLVSTPARLLRADRRALSARGTHRPREPERQPRVRAR